MLLIQGSCWEFSAGDPAAVVTVYVSDHVYDCIAPAVLRPVYSGDGLLTGEEGGGTSTDVADFAGENDGPGEGVGGVASVKIISSWASAVLPSPFMARMSSLARS